VTELNHRADLPFTVNHVDPNKLAWYADHVHEMTVPTLKRRIAEFENKIRSHSAGNLSLSASDLNVIAGCVNLIKSRLDELLPNVAANVTDHDVLNGAKVRQRWPSELSHVTYKVHLHFLELIFAWNLRSIDTTTVDEYAESFGISRFVFTNEQSRSDFVDYYDLSDFVVGETADGFHYLTLTNKFSDADVNEFLAVYDSAMSALSQLHTERLNAIRIDGGRIGYICIDHYSARETAEINRIQSARQKLGAGFKALNAVPSQKVRE
jgi:hypothetical protein